MDLDAFRIAQAVLRSMGTSGEERARVAIESALAAIVEGFYEFGDEPRIAALRRARAELARAVAMLLSGADLPPAEPTLGWVDRLEQEVLPMVGGMIRAAERGPQRRRDP